MDNKTSVPCLFIQKKYMILWHTRYCNLIFLKFLEIVLKNDAMWMILNADLSLSWEYCSPNGLCTVRIKAFSDTYLISIAISSCYYAFSMGKVPHCINQNWFLAATKQLFEWYFLSVCPSVPLSHLFDCSHHRIIMKFSEVITKDQGEVHAKGQGQRTKVKVTEITTQLNRFQTVTPVWIHIW